MTPGSSMQAITLSLLMKCDFALGPAGRGIGGGG